MTQKFVVEKFVMEDSIAYNIGPTTSSCRHTTIVPKKDIAGFLYYILPDVRKKSLSEFPYGDSIAMAIRLAMDNGKKYINFQNTDEKLKSSLASLVKDGVLKENWENYEIIQSPPAPLVESFSVKILE